MLYLVVQSFPLQFEQLLTCCGDLMVDLQECYMPTACETFAKN